MLQGWQGYWTNGKYDPSVGLFRWGDRAVIDKQSENWSVVRKKPYEETCVWVLQISIFNYTWANYDCETESGFICEVSLPRN